MRFVFVSYNYSPDIHSPQEWLDRLKIYVGSLEILSKQHSVIRVDQINYTGSFLHNGVQYYCMDSGKRKNRFPRKLNRFVKSLRPDIVIVSGLHFPIQVTMLRLTLGKKVKIIVQNHAEKPFNGIKKYMQRLADTCINAYFFASYATGLTWVSNGNIASGKKIHQVMEVSSVFYPLDAAIAKSETHVKGHRVFLWAGRLDENKDPITVVNAFLKFIAFQPTAHLYMIYQTAELLPALTLAIKNKNNDEAVRFVGKVPHPEMLYWFNSADFIISGSHYEGSGTSVCEAMSCGCVPVITDIPSFRAITDNGRCGLLYQAGNETALVSALRQTMEPAIREKRNLALQQFRDNLSFEAIAAKIQEVTGSL
jgi:glycosyltransferase involved in cell wall biosynthesis